MRFIHKIGLLVATSIWHNGAAADQLPLFTDETPLNVVLSAPLSQVYGQKKEDVRMYMPATLSYLGDDGSKQRLNLSVRTRGVYRRANCRLPPLQLNFKKKTVVGTIFGGQDKIKLVSPCAPTDNNQQRLILEYLAYKAFEVVTDKSLNTRLLRMSYIDTDNKIKPWTHTTFVIEHESDLAKRHDLKAMHVPKVPKHQVDSHQAALVEVFQLMIGNTDFSMVISPGTKDCCHNMQILGQKGASDGFLPVPYDFDSAGLIDATYARPSIKLPIKDVKDRLFRGRCRDDDSLMSAIERFKQVRPEILALFTESEHLNKRFRKKSVKYLDQFFALIDDPKRVQSQIIDRCRD